jgi:hypothetical protein
MTLSFSKSRHKGRKSGANKTRKSLLKKASKIALKKPPFHKYYGNFVKKAFSEAKSQKFCSLFSKGMVT